MDEQTQQQPPIQPPVAPQGNQSDAEKNKGIAILAYFIFFIPLLAAKDSKFAMYHANQGLLLLIFWIAGWILVSVVSFILVLTVILIPLAMLLWPALCIAELVLLIMGIINASKGEMKPLPVIGKFSIIK